MRVVDLPAIGNQHLEHASLESLCSARFLKTLNALSVGSLQNESSVCMHV